MENHSKTRNKVLKGESQVFHKHCIPETVVWGVLGKRLQTDDCMSKKAEHTERNKTGVKGTSR